MKNGKESSKIPCTHECEFLAISALFAQLDNRDIVLCQHLVHATGTQTGKGSVVRNVPLQWKPTGNYGIDSRGSLCWNEGSSELFYCEDDTVQRESITGKRTLQLIGPQLDFDGLSHLRPLPLIAEESVVNFVAIDRRNDRLVLFSSSENGEIFSASTLAGFQDRQLNNGATFETTAFHMLRCLDTWTDRTGRSIIFVVDGSQLQKMCVLENDVEIVFGQVTQSGQTEELLDLPVEVCVSNSGEFCATVEKGRETLVIIDCIQGKFVDRLHEPRMILSVMPIPTSGNSFVVSTNTGQLAIVTVTSPSVITSALEGGENSVPPIRVVGSAEKVMMWNNTGLLELSLAPSLCAWCRKVRPHDHIDKMPVVQRTVKRKPSRINQHALRYK